MQERSAADYLTQTSLLRLLAVLALVLSAHLPQLPGWEIALVIAGLSWRTLAALRQWEAPRPLIRSAIAVLVFIGIYASYGRINGQQPGTALLVAMAVMKLLEMRSRRDVMVTVFLMYFILLTHFLNSQEIWTVGYLLVCSVAITALLIDVNHPGQSLPLRTVSRMGGRMVAMALPLMLVFFVLFPRIPGPLWGLPADAGAALSGMSEEMSPGDISSLILNNEVAFRVRFIDEPPPMRQRYWRGPVFDSFDGRTWRPSSVSARAQRPEAELGEPAIRYEVIMEPHRGPWLFALDLPHPAQRPDKTMLASEYQLMQSRAMSERKIYRLTSHPNYRLEPQLTPLTTRVNLSLPRDFNPRSVELARRIRAENAGNTEAIVQAVLRKFRQENFVYTLRPPTLGRDSVDDFLFVAQRGFCEHYSSAFTFLMRAAGIPARVVIGYQGGFPNEFGDYHAVRQSDAHAWSEVWIEGKGWLRIDPTAAVAQDRIELGLAEAMGNDEGLPSFLQKTGTALLQLNIQARWDWLNNQWNRWVLAYGPELQQEFLKRFGIQDWSGMIIALTVIGSLILGVVGLLLLREFAPARNEDVALRLWHRAQKKLLRAGVAQRTGEGPKDFAERVALEHPPLADPLRKVVEIYLRLRYLEEMSPDTQRELAEAIRELKP